MARGTMVQLSFSCFGSYQSPETRKWPDSDRQSAYGGYSWCLVDNGVKSGTTRLLFRVTHLGKKASAARQIGVTADNRR